jgi:hypothetical protein
MVQYQKNFLEVRRVQIKSKTEREDWQSSQKVFFRMPGREKGKKLPGG